MARIEINEVPAALYERLQREAAREGVDVSAWMLRLLDEHLRELERETTLLHQIRASRQEVGRVIGGDEELREAKSWGRD